MAKTGERNNPVAGIYKPSCGDKQIAINKGSEFPPCPVCKKSVTWTLVQATA